MFWDKGPSALKAFICAHICNSLCTYLELDDLSDFDVDEIVKRLEPTRKLEVKQTEEEVAGSADENSCGDDVSVSV